MTSTFTLPATRLAAAAGLTALFLLGTAGAADASCTAPPTTSGSSFTGTVLTIQNNDRVAQVRTDAGAEVTVLGTESPDPNSASSVDRTLLAGARYEFHPINDATPYRDNACTATRQLGRRPGAPRRRSPRRRWRKPSRRWQSSAYGGAGLPAGDLPAADTHRRGAHLPVSVPSTRHALTPTRASTTGCPRLPWARSSRSSQGAHPVNSPKILGADGGQWGRGAGGAGRGLSLPPRATS